MPDNSSRLRVAIIAESEPYYLAEAMERLLINLPEHIECVHALITNYGHGRQSVSSGVGYRSILRVFGAGVLLRGIARYAWGKLHPAYKVESVFQRAGIPVEREINDPNSPAAIALLRSLNVDLIASVAVNKLFSPELRRTARLGCINVHSGVRPEHRGKAGIFWALADGCTETGVTIHYLDDGVDSGAEIVKFKKQISTKSFAVLLRQIRLLGSDALVEAFRRAGRDRPSPTLYNATSLEPCRLTPTEADLREFKNAGYRIF